VQSPPHIITIQEARLKDLVAARRLNHTYKGYMAIGLASPAGTDGVIILLSEAFISLGVTNINTVLRDSRAVSVRFTLLGENYHVLNLYLPNNDNARKSYIRTMVNPFQAKDEFCIITMDANFVESRRRDRAHVQRPDTVEA
jgi:exonuclease III